MILKFSLTPSLPHPLPHPLPPGELEFVSHATRRHTRDVGTTFPSPAGPHRDPQASVKERRSSRRSQSKPLTKG